jgi:hypothetical protein
MIYQGVLLPYKRLGRRCYLLCTHFHWTNQIEVDRSCYEFQARMSPAYTVEGEVVPFLVEEQK